MQSDESTKVTKATRGSLEALRREFERCASRYPALYHEMWKPHCEIPEDYNVEDICASFRKAFAVKFDDGWQEWDGPEDISYFGRYYGNGEGLREFKTLADSASMLMTQVDFRPADLGRTFSSDCVSAMALPMLPAGGDRGFNDWLTLLYRLGLEYPSPLLMCGHEIWVGNGEATAYEALSEPESGAPYPLHPWHLSIAQPLFSASIAAIDLILDKGGTVLIGTVASEEGEAQAAGVEQDHQVPGRLVEVHPGTRSAAQSETSQKGPVLLFELHGREWHFEFDTGHGILKRKYVMKGRPIKGFEVCRFLISQPNEKKEPKEIFKEIGQGWKVDKINTEESSQEQSDEESTEVYDKAQTRLWKRFDDAVGEDEKQQIWEEYQDVERKKREVQHKTPFPSYNSKYADQIQSQIALAISKIETVLSELGTYLKERLRRKDCCFIYARDDYLYRLLRVGAADIY